MGWRSTTAWVTGLLLAGCASGDTSSADNFTFGAGGGQGDTGPTDGMAMSADGTAGASASGGADGGPGGGADGVACVDGDGDAYGPGCAAGSDCDDTDPQINPGAGEACNGIDDNCDDLVDNGCECPEDGVSGACNSPTELGVIDVGDNVLGVVGTLPQEGAIDWYTVSFPAAVRPGEGIPTLGFSINTGEGFAFDVMNTQCDATASSCSEGGTMGSAMALTSWSFQDNDPGCCAPPMDSLVPWPSQVFVRVYRTTVGASCDTYQLQASR